MFVLEVSRLSDEFIRIPTRGRLSGADIDPTTFTGAIAFMPGNTLPTTPDFVAATWETDATVSPARYYLLRKATTLGAGNYMIWAKIATGTETVQRDVGILHVK